MPETDDTLLPVFLRDRTAAAVAAVELARRALRGARGTAFEGAMPGVVAGFEADLRALREVCAAHGVQGDRLKERAAVVAERLGRLKRNGRVRTPSPLSRVTELEGLEALARLLAGTFRGLEATGLGGPAVRGRAADAEWRAGELSALRDRAMERALRG